MHLSAKDYVPHFEDTSVMKAIEVIHGFVNTGPVDPDGKYTNEIYAEYYDEMERQAERDKKDLDKAVRMRLVSILDDGGNELQDIVVWQRSDGDCVALEVYGGSDICGYGTDLEGACLDLANEITNLRETAGGNDADLDGEQHTALAHINNIFTATEKAA